ncbi:MAG: ABC transporter ATP-binding protein [Alphaproteobacteria bacterium]|nr:ABC transporter ATP-binding protein [Alphaproteobacteria bacterium]NCQ87765.1 ABC transporter ATP-binding protein [Alphaproteobacteria bacterium]NCT05727.1 ABC transporter ATP-binding protein [Alphaproteobacteria bacterium]
MDKQPILSVKDLSSGYKDRVIFEDLSFNINPREVYGLVGLNGIGKTTLIKTILGLKDPIKGDVIVSSMHEGKAFNKSDIAYLPERFDPPWFLSGYEFLKFSLSLYGKKITFDEAAHAATGISLDPNYLKKRVNAYSKGMRQKLGLLATVLTQCPIMILDEPMSGLDPKARSEVKALIKTVREQGRSILMSSHILADIRELCDRVAVFDSGVFVFEGTPAEMSTKGKDQNLETAFLNILQNNNLKAA